MKLVEKAENQSADKAIYITTTTGTVKSSFLLANVHDRDFVVDKISLLMSKCALPK